jgi:acid phosphatase type 7
MKCCLILLMFTLQAAVGLAQDIKTGLLGDWWLWPEYTLPARANNTPGNQPKAPASVFADVDSRSIPLVLKGEEPTQRLTGILPQNQLPSSSFTVECWLVNHVNQAVGMLAAVKPKYTGAEPQWLLGVYEREIIFSLKPEKEPFAAVISHEIKARGWKNYWGHLVGVYDGSSMKLYLNGELLGEQKVGAMAAPTQDRELEVAAYMHNEPYMQLGNLLKNFRLYNRALTLNEIKQRNSYLQKLVEEGKLWPDTFHFNAGPYLNYATTSSINLLWETDRPAKAVVEYGESLPLKQKRELPVASLKKEGPGAEEKYIQELTLDNLQPGTTYFYNVKVVSEDGQEMESGVLTFATAVEKEAPFAFGIIGDTEARPHVNDRVAKMLWDERPNFLMIVGDLTDGGQEHHKFEWNYEYFAAMTQLTSRVPVFPVAGNGESDLYWYNQYHVLLEPEGFYSFTYGNAEFFMLNSNQRDEFAPGKKQYVWLEEKLKASTAKWKFVAHHHAPYSADEDDYGNSWEGPTDLGDKKVREIVPLYEKYGVDMVFFGHLHTYQRTMPIEEGKVQEQNGVIYIQAGGAGGNLEDFAPTRAWFSAKTYRGHHYCIVGVNGGSLSFKMYDTEGKLKDFLELRK